MDVQYHLQYPEVHSNVIFFIFRYLFYLSSQFRFSDTSLFIIAINYSLKVKIVKIFLRCLNIWYAIMYVYPSSLDIIDFLQKNFVLFSYFFQSTQVFLNFLGLEDVIQNQTRWLIINNCFCLTKLSIRIYRS